MKNAMQRFWNRTWNSVTFANTIISNVDKVEAWILLYATCIWAVLISIVLMLLSWCIVVW